MKGLKEGLAAVSAVIAMAGAEDARAQEETSIIPDPNVRAVTCKIYAKNVAFDWSHDAAMIGVSPSPVSTHKVQKEAEKDCLATTTPPEPTPAEKRQAKCAEMGAQMHDYMLQLLDDTSQALLPESRRSPLAHALGHALDSNALEFADNAAAAAENECLADEEKVARVKCDDEGKNNGTDSAMSMARDHLLGFGRDRKSEKSSYDITSACLAREGLKP